MALCRFHILLALVCSFSTIGVCNSSDHAIESSRRFALQYVDMSDALTKLPQPHSSWAGLLARSLDDGNSTDTSEHAQGKNKRKRGRPPNLYGSHALRRQMKLDALKKDVPAPPQPKRTRRTRNSSGTLSVRPEPAPLEQQLSTTPALNRPPVKPAQWRKHLVEANRNSRGVAGADEAKQQVRTLAGLGPDPTDDAADVDLIETRRIIEHLAAAKCSLKSLEALSEELDIDRKKVQATSLVWGNGLAHGSRICFEDHILKCKELQKDGKYVSKTLIMKCRYDETPTMLKITSLGFIEDLPSDVVIEEDVHRAKILQSDLEFLMIGRDASNNTCYLSGDILCWLQCIERNTGECIQQALGEQWPDMTSANDTFSRKIKVVVTDAFGANTRGEECTLATTQKDWDYVHLYCDAHAAHRVAESSFDVFAEDISALIKFCLVLCNSGGMSKFRKTIRQEIRDKLVVIKGSRPSVEADEHRERVLDVFLRKGKPRSKGFWYVMCMGSNVNCFG